MEEGDVCPICLSGDEEVGLVHLSSCRHVYHNECIKTSQDFGYTKCCLCQEMIATPLSHVKIGCNNHEVFVSRQHMLVFLCILTFIQAFVIGVVISGSISSSIIMYIWLSVLIMVVCQVMIRHNDICGNEI